MKKVATFICFVALMIAPSITSVASTNTCNHNYNAHRLLGAGYSTNVGVHQIVYNGRNVLCTIYDDYTYCELSCSYCGAAKPNSRHAEKTATRHTYNH